MKTQNDFKTKGKVSFFTKCLAVYFMLVVCDIFNVAGLGTILKLYAVALIAIWVLQIKEARIALDSTFFLQIGYIALCFLSLAYSISLPSSLSAFTTLAMNFGLVILCQSIEFSEIEVKVLRRSLIIGGVIVFIASFFFADFSEAGRLTIKIAGDSADQNELNGYLLFAFSYFVYAVINNSGNKILNFVAICLFLGFALLTGSRGALLALAAVAITLLLIKVRKSKKDIIKVVLFILILLICIQFILSLLPEDVAIRFSLEYIEDTGTTSRTKIWEALLTRFFNDDLFSILFGKGIFTTPIYNTYDDHVAHNTFIDILIGTGFVGLLFYVMLIISMLKKAWKSENYMLFAALCGFIVMMLSLTLVTYKPIFNSLIIIEIAYRTFKKGKSEKV